MPKLGDEYVEERCLRSSLLGAEVSMDDRSRMGKVAYIRYRGRAKGEDVYDDRTAGAPLPVVLGDRRVPRGIEDALFEMRVGEQRMLEVPSNLAYGDYDEKAAQWYTRILLERGEELKVGSMVVWTNPEDQSQRPARVIDETSDAVKIDFNHPFAGKTLEYWVELVELG